jgi:uncharacterized membrane protein
MAEWRTSAAGLHLVVSLTAGALAGALAGPSLGGETAGLLAWVVAAAVFLLWTWASIWSLDARDTAWFAAREDASRPVRDVAMLSISIGALVTVVVVIFRVHENPPERTALAVTAIAASWLVMNTIFTLRYARLYYAQPRGGVDFNQDDDPTFRDFAYVAFTIGMTFQVSDTTLSKTEMRATVLRQGLMSFVYNTVIVAVTVNIIAGLSR